jgi:hypothetical protein
MLLRGELKTASTMIYGEKEGCASFEKKASCLTWLSTVALDGSRAVISKPRDRCCSRYLCYLCMSSENMR